MTGPVHTCTVRFAVFIALFYISPPSFAVFLYISILKFLNLAFPPVFIALVVPSLPIVRAKEVVGSGRFGLIPSYDLLVGAAILKQVFTSYFGLLCTVLYSRLEASCTTVQYRLITFSGGT